MPVKRAARPGGAQSGGRSLEWEAGGVVRALGGAWEVQGRRVDARVPPGSRCHGSPGGVPGGGGSARQPYLLPDSPTGPSGSR